MARYNSVDPHPDFPKIEKEILDFWERERVFEKSLEKTQDGEPFTFYDGPPFATGLPHYGHILASTIKDVVPRYQTMKGRFVRRRWGWDCHGLPIEELVERELDISGKKQIEEIGTKKFNETCRSLVLRYAEEWGKMVRRIARWVEFDNSYKTMDTTYMESVWWAFKEVYKKDLVYEGRKVLLYCPRCETPVSNFEVAMDNSYRDVEDETVTVKFEVVGENDTYLLAWTTTPWTLPGNVALAVGEDLVYAKVEHAGDSYILAEDLVEKVFGEKEYNVIEKISGNELVGLTYKPLFETPAVHSENSYKVYEAGFVTTEEGTGIVHTAVVYGEEDYALGVEKELPVVPLLDEKGVFNSDAPELVRGTYFKKAEPAIIDDLQKRELVFDTRKHTHPYPYCWRCESALFYNAIPAWFVNVQEIKDDLIKTNKKEISWYPDHLKHGRYENSVQAAPDWNISRNRYWGNPIPVWKCTDESCGHREVAGSLQDLNEKRSDEPATFFFMRHGEAVSNVENFVSSHPETKDNPLTTKGQEEVGKAADALAKEGIGVIYASDLQRTKETAEIVAEKLGCEVRYEEDLREIDMGTFNGHDISEYRHYLDFIDKHAGKNGDKVESYDEVRARVIRKIREIAGEYAGEKVLVISHGGPLHLLELALMGEGYESDAYVENRLLPAQYRKHDMPNWPFNDAGEVDLHRPYIDEIALQCSKCENQMQRTSEIFDSWMEASAMPFAEYHYPFENKETFEKRFPAQFVAEYIAQTRAWFYTMHVLNLILFKGAPFENVVTTGNILAEDGEKMSKSKGNFPDPWKVIEEHGVDTLRFYLMNSSVMSADDMSFSERDLQTTHRKVVRILWNVYNYFVTYANEAEWVFDPKTSPAHTKESDNVLDQWVNARLAQLVGEVTEQLDDYNTVRATRAMEIFIDDLSTWYLRRSRGRDDDAFFATLYRVLIYLSKVMAPVTPYMTESIYQNLHHEDYEDSVHLAEWPSLGELSKDESQLLSDMQKVQELASTALARRSDEGVKLRQPLASVTVGADHEDLFGKRNPNLKTVLIDEVNVREVFYSSSLEHNDVKIDTKLTLELEREGMFRELTRAVNSLRKKADLTPSNQIVLAFHVVNAKGEEEPFEDMRDELAADARAKDILFGKTDEVDEEREWEDRGWQLWAGIKKK